MLQNHKVISTSPATEKRYLDVLVPYLLRNRGLIDEHHFWQASDAPDTLDCIHSLCETHRGFFRSVPPPTGNGDPLGVFMTDEYKTPDVLYLHFGARICYLAEDAVAKLIEFRLAHPEHFLVVANTVNNAYIDHLRQRMMLVEFAPFIGSPNAMGNSRKDARFAEAVHWTFLRHLAEEKLICHQQMFYRWVCHYFERVSLDCISWMGQDMALVNVPREDSEKFLSCIAPRQMVRPIAVCGGAVVSNYAADGQVGKLDKTDIFEQYKKLAAGDAIAKPVPRQDVYPVEKMPIYFFTCDRRARGKKNYIDDSLGNLARATGGDPRLNPVRVIIDGPDGGFLKRADVPVVAMPVPRTDWEGRVSGWNVHRRISYSYHRCFAHALENDDCCGLLICEDDVDFRDGFLEKLQQVLDEMAEDGKRWFTLSLYTVGDLDGCSYLDMGDLYGVYPEKLFWGGQGVFFSRDIIELAMEYWARNGWRDVRTGTEANDRLVGRFGHSLWRRFGDAGGHFQTYRDLVQHEGEVTTGLSGYYHYSESFTRPWPGESEKSETEIAEPTAQALLQAPEDLHLLSRKVKPEHVALAASKAFFLPMAGIAANAVMFRILARHLGLSADAVSMVEEIRFPYFHDGVPGGYYG